MNTKRPTELATKFLKHVEAREGSLAGTMIADDAAWWALSIGDIGKADVLKAHAGIFAFTERTDFDIRTHIEEGNRVATELLVTYHFKDGRVVENPMHIAFTFENDQIIAAREYLDPNALKAFGL
jgi:ketosteroid isomerase-like protein